MPGIIRRAIARWLPLIDFRSSGDYWTKRYRKGGDSGSGSGGEAARYKAAILNAFVRDENVLSVIEFGCGDGRQLELADYPTYLGVDVSPEAIALCRAKFAGDCSKRFAMVDECIDARAELSLSLDVMFHLVEDDVYEEHLLRLFGSSERFVLIYSTDVELKKGTLPHVRHRNVSADVRARFPGFARMSDRESALAPPVEFSRGAPSRFLMYRRVPSK